MITDANDSQIDYNPDEGANNSYYAFMADKHSVFNFNPLEWTQTPPTKPGWYWVVANNSDDKTPYLMNLITDPVLGGLYFESVGLYWTEGMEIYKISAWLGPLPVPPAPEEAK